MRETPFSNCERAFILRAIENKERLDGRDSYDYRKIKVEFGIDRGSCTVELGDTIVFAQVTCEVGQPRQTRPTEGYLYINVEFSPMAEAHFEPGKQGEQGSEIARILERCIRDSRAVDLESLCIMAGSKVWKLRIDVKVLNYDGNPIDAAALSSIAALSHFRRPDVSVSGEEVTIHSSDEKDPIPLSMHHLPLCVTIAFFHQGTYSLIDPLAKEEKVMDGKMIIGMNKHREICALQMTGTMLLVKEQVLRCTQMATVKIVELNEILQKSLTVDEEARASGKPYGCYVFDFKKVTVNKAERIQSDNDIEILDNESIQSLEKDLDSDHDVVEIVDDNAWLLRVNQSHRLDEVESVKEKISSEIDQFLDFQRKEISTNENPKKKNQTGKRQQQEPKRKYNAKNKKFTEKNSSNTDSKSINLSAAIKKKTKK